MKDAETIRMEIEQQIVLREGELAGLRAAADALTKEQPRSSSRSKPLRSRGKIDTAHAKA